MSSRFWDSVDRFWVSLASVKITIVVLAALLLLSIPGTVILQTNISNIDPGIQYDYDFWRFGQLTQLFTAYHSFWYTGLIVLLSMNLIACSVERWPQMWKLANARPVPWQRETFQRQPEGMRHFWSTRLGKSECLTSILAALEARRVRPQLIEDGPKSFQIFWQSGRWSRVANYLVHTSLLIIFAGAIISALYGFEGAANIPAGSAVDTFIMFKEGKGSGLRPAPGGLPNERLLGFRLQAEDFKVNFYEDFPGRPKEFISKLNVLENNQVKLSKTIRVNDPLEYKNFTFYQASYGRVGDFNLDLRVIDRKSVDARDPNAKPVALRSHLGEVQKIDSLKVQFVPVMAVMNLAQRMGPAVQIQEIENGKAKGEPFWVLKDYAGFDLRRKSNYVVILADLEEMFFTGLQIAHDPGAPIYWFGCAGMLLGTFYALFVKHKKYQLRFDQGELAFAGSIHRLPTGFENEVERWAERLQEASEGRRRHRGAAQTEGKES